MLFRERQQTVICVAAGAMVLGFVLFRYVPLQKKTWALEQTRAAKKLVIAKASIERRYLPALKEQLLTQQRVIKHYEANIPEQRELGVFLQRITSLMSEHNLEEQQIQPGKEIGTEKLNCIPVTIQCRGRLEEIFKFYSQLRELDRLVRVERVELVNDSDFKGEVKMQTKASIYYRAGAKQG